MDVSTIESHENESKHMNGKATNALGKRNENSLNDESQPWIYLHEENPMKRNDGKWNVEKRVRFVCQRDANFSGNNFSMQFIFLVLGFVSRSTFHINYLPFINISL